MPIKGAGMNQPTTIAERALNWHTTGRGAVLATVVETWGSAPRATGSQLVVDAQGAMEGSVSGGCVEGAVITEALDALTDGKPRLLTFGVSDDDAFAAGLACGGTIRVLVEPVGTALPLTILQGFVAAQQAHKPTGWAVSLANGGHTPITPKDHPDRFRLDRSGVEDDEDTFVLIGNPPLRIIIIGAVHIAQDLVPIAQLAGYDVTVIDPRPAFGAAARFPGQTIIDDWPDEALGAIGLDNRTAVVTLSHDPKIDDPAIVAALRSQVFYLGCLGSRRTHAKRLDRLGQFGFGTDDTARIHAPVGLDIGGRKPAEIAISIMAEITQTLRKAV
jgi:xanthine dehydrogenase accessory factor